MNLVYRLVKLYNMSGSEKMEQVVGTIVSGEIFKIRLYARGEQPIGKYKNELAVDGDLSYLNLDWTPVPILPKFIDIVVNGMADRLFKVNAYAQDAMSQAKRTNFQDMVHGQMVAKPFLN